MYRNTFLLSLFFLKLLGHIFYRFLWLFIAIIATKRSQHAIYHFFLALLQKNVYQRKRELKDLRTSNIIIVHALALLLFRSIYKFTASDFNYQHTIAIELILYINFWPALASIYPFGRQQTLHFILYLYVFHGHM